ncbi:phage portal protein [Aureimonas ureilytica]|uniref:phage portal protein n=1 Tax=Aureimonas ureilytica TaxID=401562 RepID=UPI000A90CB39|nr:phage portal protein [Aureimonas ureilytica]
MASWIASKVGAWLGRDARPGYGLSDPRLTELFGGTPAAAGIAVTPASAMRSTPVRCAVQTIAEAIGQLPIHVVERGADGSKERATTHPAYALIHDQANDWTPASELLEQVTRDALLHGNGYAFINRAGDEPRELIRLDPSAVAVDRSTTGEPAYAVTERGGRRFIDRRDMIHIKAPSLDGLSGASPIMQGQEAIALALVMEQHAAKLFANGARPSGILKFPNKLGAETAPRIKASWNGSHAGGNRSGGTAVLEEGGEFQPLTFSSVDAQFLELWQHVITEIARIFRVPPHMLFELGRATWGNAEEMGASFVRFGLMRWVKVWQGELRLKLFSPEERARFTAEFILDDLLRADTTTRFEAYSKAITARILNPNEVRARENLPPYAGGEEFANPHTTSGAAGGDV